MIELAGGINIAAGASGAYPRLSMETVLKKDPEILIFPVGSTESVPEHEQQDMEAVDRFVGRPTHRLHVVSSDALNRPGPRVMEGLEQLGAGDSSGSILLRLLPFFSAMTISPSQPASSVSDRASSPKSDPQRLSAMRPTSARPFSLCPDGSS